MQRVAEAGVDDLKHHPHHLLDHAHLRQLFIAANHSKALNDSRYYENKYLYCIKMPTGWLGSRVVSVLDSGAVGPGFKSQPRRCRVTVLGKLFTPIVPLFTEQQNW